MALEEVDSIIVVTLKDIGLELDDDIKTLKQLMEVSDRVLKSVMMCLQIIDPQGRKWPKAPPRGITSKVALGTEVANAVKALGYQADLSYHQLVYPNEGDTRRLLAWLIERLPKEGFSKSDAPTAPRDLVNRAIEEQLKKQQHETFTPVFTRPQRYRDVYPFHAAHIVSCFLPGPRSSRYKPARRQDVAPSILEHNTVLVLEARQRDKEKTAIGMKNPFEWRRQRKAELMNSMKSILKKALQNAGKGDVAFITTGEKMKLSKESRVSHMIAFADSIDVPVPGDTPARREESEQELEERRAKELAALDAKLEELSAEAAKYASEIDSFYSNLRQLEASLQAEQKKNEELEKTYKNTRIVADLIPDAANNIVKLQTIKDQALENLIQLAKEWEVHRAPLIEKYRRLMDELSNKKDDTKQKMEKIKEMRRLMAEIAEDVKQKEERYKQLLDVYNNLPRDLSRAHYTRRILDIVKNVKKQKADINKILIDTRTLKKEINTINDTLSRSFAVVDELIYADAPKDPTAKQAYKHFVAINESFKKLIETVEEIGHTKNAILELESKSIPHSRLQIAAIEGRTNTLNMERLLEDLKSVRKENAELAAKLKKQGQS